MRIVIAKHLDHDPSAIKYGETRDEVSLFLKKKDRYDASPFFPPPSQFFKVIDLQPLNEFPALLIKVNL